MNEIINYLENRNLFTSRLAFVRLLLALSALLLLLFTNISLGTDSTLLDLPSPIPNDAFYFRTISIFVLLGAKWGRIISICIMLFVITGYLPKISILLQAWVHLSLCNSLIVIEGGDQISSNLCILLIPICLFDNRKNQWKTPEIKGTTYRNNCNIFFNVYYFLIRFQVAVIYLHSATGKLLQKDWLDGTCMYYWITNNVFGTSLFLQKFWNIITLSNFVPLFSWSVIFFELGLFACIIATNKYIQRFFLLLGLTFHFGILITHGLFEFFFSMFAALVLYLDYENFVLNKINLFFKTIKNYINSKILNLKILYHGTQRQQ